MRFMLTLSRTPDDTTEGADIDVAAEGVTREVYLADSTPVLVHDDTVATIDPAVLALLTDALAVGLDGIEGDDDWGTDPETVDAARTVLVSLLKAVQA